MTVQSTLIIDDSESDQILCGHAIRAFDPSVKINDVYAAYEGLELLAKRHKFDVLLLDINMPDMNGFEFLDMYRKIYGNDAHKIYLLLGTAPQSDIHEKIEEYDCLDGALLKPLDKQDVKKIMGQDA